MNFGPCYPGASCSVSGPGISSWVLSVGKRFGCTPRPFQDVGAVMNPWGFLTFGSFFSLSYNTFQHSVYSEWQAKWPEWIECLKLQEIKRSMFKNWSSFTLRALKLERKRMVRTHKEVGNWVLYPRPRPRNWNWICPYGFDSFAPVAQLSKRFCLLYTKYAILFI